MKMSFKNIKEISAADVAMEKHYALEYTVDSNYLKVKWPSETLRDIHTFDISDLQNWGKYESNNQSSQMNM